MSGVQIGWKLVAAGMIACATTSIVRGDDDKAVKPAKMNAEEKASSIDFDFARRLSRVFATVAEQSGPSVVHITRIEEGLVRRGFFDAPKRQLVRSGLGSGVIVREDGIVLTNSHVVRGAEKLLVRLDDGREYEATLVDDVGPSIDLAVVKIEAPTEKFPALSFADSNDVRVGDWVVAIGSPFGLDSSVTQGIVSAKGRTVSPRESGMQFQDYLQTDAAINPGNSGGPLLNLQGQIVGINSAIASRTGGYDGIGFSIPANLAKAVLDNILVNGRLQRGYLGVEFTQSTGAVPGAEVRSVIADSPADKAGLREGDIITKFNGAATNDQLLMSSLAVQAPGSNVKIEVVRDGQPKAFDVVVGSFDEAYGVKELPEVGIKVRPLQPKDRETLSMMGHRTKEGVIVTEVKQGSLADGSLSPGDVIVGVDRDKVKDIRTLERAISSANMDRSNVQVSVIRGSQRGFVMLGER